MSYTAAFSEKDAPNISIGAAEMVPDFYTTLTLSSTEAMAGVNRTLTLPGQQHITIAIPAGVYDGQVIRMEGRLGSSSPDVRKGDLVVKITIIPRVEPVVTESIPGLPPVTWKRYLLFGLALLVLVPSIIGISYFVSNQLIGQKAPSAPVNISNSNKNIGMPSTQTTSSAASLTAQVTLAAQATAYPYDYTPKALVLNNPLDIDSSARWDQTSGACIFTEGAYHVMDSPQATMPQVCVAHNSNFSNFTSEVQMNILKGSGGGILFRSTDSASYYFRLDQSGSVAYYTLFACTQAVTSCNPILSRNFTSSFNVGHANTIAIVAKGNSIEMYVNDTRINAITDNTSLHGQIGLMAEPGSEIAFSDAKVWTL